MDKHALYIKNRLSLRPPQTESLKLLAGIADILPLKKDADLATEKEKVLTFTGDLAAENGSARVFTDFERDFPCVCFALVSAVP